MVDTGSILTAELVHKEIRGWSKKPLHSAVFSHGHIDHVFGVGPFDEEAATNNWARPRVLAHEHLPKRFERYIMTAGYNQVINRRQFAAPNLVWPTEYRFPDETYEHDHGFSVGSDHFRLARVTSSFGTVPTPAIPKRSSATPSNGHRHCVEWSTWKPNFLLPGHGLPVLGKERIHQALSETAEYLESIVEQTLALMNNGVRLTDVISTVHVPSHLAGRPYLQPFYDEPEFIVRNIWRLYGGWWDGNPANLRPANDRALARELSELAGGPTALADRAELLLNDPSDEELRLAGHLVELAWLAAPDDEGIQVVRPARLWRAGRARDLHHVAWRLSVGRARISRSTVVMTSSDAVSKV